LNGIFDPFNRALLGSAAIPLLLDWAALIGFSVVFVLFALTFHRRNLMKACDCSKLFIRRYASDC
jgi:hypothetical protein